MSRFACEIHTYAKKRSSSVERPMRADTGHCGASASTSYFLHLNWLHQSCPWSTFGDSPPDPFHFSQRAFPSLSLFYIAQISSSFLPSTFADLFFYSFSFLATAFPLDSLYSRLKPASTSIKINFLDPLPPVTTLWATPPTRPKLKSNTAKTPRPQKLKLNLRLFLASNCLKVMFSSNPQAPDQLSSTG